jgi:CheY-like chemotaxis protein
MLAGGIAHEFNNLLMGILGNTELVLEQVKVGTQAHQCAAQIDVAGRHASELCRQLLAYSGKGQFVVESLNLNVMIRDMSRLLELSVPKTCALKRVLADGLPDMKGDSRQIRQVIMNLVANAAEAVGAEQGTITIETGARNCDREYLSSPYLSEDREPGDYCYVKVSDTGHGMESSTMQRMFDPFFSTRFTGRGLGLPAVLGIVRGHKGAIIVSSEENRGSVFQVLFPVAAGAEKPPVRKPPAVDGTPASGTVLLVDDDEIVRSVSRLMLQGGGFRVLLAGDGVEAVDTYREHMNEIVCVVMDRTMPRMNGDMAMRAIRVLNPDAPVVMSSGYDAAEMSRGAPDCGIDGFLQKPYRKEQLLNAVRAVAGQSRRKASSDTASEKV